MGFNFTFSTEDYSFRDNDDNNNFSIIDIMLEDSERVFAIDLNEKIDKVCVDKHIIMLEKWSLRNRTIRRHHEDRHAGRFYTA